MRSFWNRVLLAVHGWFCVALQRAKGETPLTWKQWEASRSLPEYDPESERRIMRQVSLGHRQNVTLLPYCLPGGHRHALWASSAHSEDPE